MSNNISRHQKLKKKYLNYIKSQEVLSEPFRNKIDQLENYYIPIGKMIFKSHKRKSVNLIGLSGGQGSGKSTIAQIIKIILKEKFSLNTVIFSIDDFYKTFKERQEMSHKVSPLFLTRGVPGTHDTKLLIKCIKNLKREKFKITKIPRFDKSIDDRLPKCKWQKITKKPDIIIFEGWCVGATPQNQKDLSIPINKLEIEEDKKRIWRSTVNNELKKSYKKIFDLIDKMVYLKVPNFQKVFKWRILQEKKLRLFSKGKKIMSNSEIKRFVMFYERLTKHMLKDLSKKADIVVKIDNQHKLKSLKFN